LGASPGPVGPLGPPRCVRGMAGGVNQGSPSGPNWSNRPAPNNGSAGKGGRSASSPEEACPAWARRPVSVADPSTAPGSGPAARSVAAVPPGSNSATPAPRAEARDRDTTEALTTGPSEERAAAPLEPHPFP